SPETIAARSAAASGRSASGIARRNARGWRRREIAIDHPMHVQDVALLPRIESQAAEAARAHAGLLALDVHVVLGRDLAPVARPPVGEETALGHRPRRLRARPLEHPRV